jgi:hypothetical protein
MPPCLTWRAASCRPEKRAQPSVSGNMSDRLIGREFLSAGLETRLHGRQGRLPPHANSIRFNFGIRVKPA